MAIVFADHVDQIVQNGHKPLIFAMGVRDEDSGCQFRPDVLSRLKLWRHHLILPISAVVFHLPWYRTYVRWLSLLSWNRGFSEMRFEKRLQLAILYGSDPDNENQVAMGSRLLQRMSF